MLPGFAYVRPRTLNEALAHLAAPGARVHAGGTDLLGCLRDGVFAADLLVSLSALRELQGISVRPDGQLRIGALTTLAEIAAHPLIRERYAALAQGAAAAASPQLRNQGTLGGNLCQRPRCWYYRGDFKCARKGGDVCFAAAGENEQHAIFGGSPCFIVHPSDTAAPLLALDARVRIANRSGERSVDLQSFFLLPEQDLERENVLGAGDLVTEVLLPQAPAGLRSSYRKVASRGAWDFALAGVALALQLRGERVGQARVVLSGVAPVPWRVSGAEAAILGRRLDAGTVARAAEAAVAGAQPLDANGYKVALVKGVVEEALLGLA